MAIRLPSGFIITAGEPVDSRLVLTKAEMKAIKAGQMPDSYFALCSDDNKIYIYNKTAEIDPDIGRFRSIEDFLNFSSPAAQDQLNEAIKNSNEITTIRGNVTALQGNVTTLQDDVSTLSTTVSSMSTTVAGLSTDMTDIKPKVNDQLIPKVATLETTSTQTVADVATIKTWIDNVKLDGGEIKSQYDLIGEVLHVVPASTNPIKIAYKGTATLAFTEMSGYSLPNTVTVNNVVITNGAAFTECNGVKAKWIADTAGGHIYLQDATKDVRYIVSVN